MGGHHHGALDVLLLLALQRFGMRTIEAIVLLLIATIGCVLLHRDFHSPANPAQFSGKWGGPLISPRFGHAGMLYVAIGIIGATVMPHNLYLHSALVQSRKLQKDEAVHSEARSAFNTIDSIVALTVAFFVNAAILVLAATVFFGRGKRDRVGRAVGQVQRRQRLDSGCLFDARGPLLGDGCREHAVCGGAPGKRPEQHHHGNARRASGDGKAFMHWRIKPWGTAAHHAARSPSCRRS